MITNITTTTPTNKAVVVVIVPTPVLSNVEDDKVGVLSTISPMTIVVVDAEVTEIEVKNIGVEYSMPFSELTLQVGGKNIAVTSFYENGRYFLAV